MRRGFTVLEASMTLGLVLLIAAASLTLVGSSPDVGADLGSRASISTALDAVVEIELDGGDLASVERLGALTADVTFTTGASTGPLELSVAADVDGRLVIASSNGLDVCWFVIRDPSPDANQPVLFHAFDASGGACTASSYLTIDPTNFSVGASWRDPAEIV